MPTELTDKEKCLVVQMMLRQSPRLTKLPKEIKESIQLFYKQTVYPSLSAQDISQINLDLDKFLLDAEKTMQKGLIKAIGKQGFQSIMKKFGLGVKTEDTDNSISDSTIREMEEKIKSAVNEDKD